MLDKTIKNNKSWGIIVAVGIITVVFGAISYKSIPNNIRHIAMLKGMFFGLGISFTAVGSFKLIQGKITPKSKLKAKEIEAKDERNIQIMRISYSAANFVAIVLFALMAFLFVGFNYIIPAIISLGAMYIQILTIFIAYKYYNKKM